MWFSCSSFVCAYMAILWLLQSVRFYYYYYLYFCRSKMLYLFVLCRLFIWSNIVITALYTACDCQCDWIGLIEEFHSCFFYWNFTGNWYWYRMAIVVVTERISTVTYHNLTLCVGWCYYYWQLVRPRACAEHFTFNVTISCTMILSMRMMVIIWYRSFTHC